MDSYPEGTRFEDPGYEIRDVNEEIQNELMMDQLRKRMTPRGRGIEGLRRFFQMKPDPTPYLSYGPGI